MLCKQLDVAASGYSGYCSGKLASTCKQRDGCLHTHIRAIHERGRGIYGAIKIKSELNAEGIQVGLNRIRRYATLKNQIPADFA